MLDLRLIILFSAVLFGLCSICLATGIEFPYDRLSNEEITRFPIENYPENLQKSIIKSVKKFPGVRDCIRDNEMTKGVPDLKQFDWGKITSNEDAVVCIFRVFDTLHALGMLDKWFVYHGFRTSHINYSSPNIEFVTLNATWSVSDRGIKFPTTGLFHWISAYFVSFQSISITISDGHKVRIDAGLASK